MVACERWVVSFPGAWFVVGVVFTGTRCFFTIYVVTVIHMALPSEIPNCSSGLTSLSWLQNISLSVQLEVDGIACSGGSDRDASKGRTSKESKSLAEPKAESKPRKPRTSHDTTGKPPYSFASLIFMAIEASPSKCLPVKDIYTWIITHFPYYRSAAPAWKNSVRHNLSLNKCFGKKGEDSDCRVRALVTVFEVCCVLCNHVFYPVYSWRFLLLYCYLIPCYIVHVWECSA